MRTYYVAPIPPLQIVDGAAFATFTTFQSIGPVPGIVLPANILEPGSEITLEADGEYSDTGTPTLGLGFLFGATVLAQSTPITAGSTVTSVPWHSRWTGRVRTAGATGTIQGAGFCFIGSSLTAFNAAQAMPATKALRTITLDTTSASVVAPGASWGTSASANTITVNRFTCQLIS